MDVENNKQTKREEKNDPGIFKCKNIPTRGAVSRILRKHEHSPRVIKHDQAGGYCAAKLNAVELAAGGQDWRLHGQIFSRHCDTLDNLF